MINFRRFYDSIFVRIAKSFSYILIWSNQNREMLVSLYIPNGENRLLTLPFKEQLKQESVYLKQHNSSKLVYVDYYMVFIRGLFLICMLVIWISSVVIWGISK